MVKEIGKTIASSTKSDRRGDATNTDAINSNAIIEEQVEVVELEAFTEWWLGNHSDLGRMLTTVSVFCICVTIVFGFYAEVRIWYVIAARADDGGLRTLNQRIQDSLNDIQSEFTRHMHDIFDSAKKTVGEDDDLDVFSLAMLGILEQREMFSDHHKVMSRIAVQTFLELAEEPVEEAGWPGAHNLYEDEELDELTLRHWREQNGSDASPKDHNAAVRAGWHHWEREAFHRRNLSHNEEWVSRDRGHFQQGPTMIDVVACEDYIVAILACLGGKDELLTKMIEFHDKFAQNDVSPEFNKARIKAIKAIWKAKRNSRDTIESNPIFADEEDDGADALDRATDDAFDIDERTQHAAQLAS
eukprot:COSAG05_NODE_3281_length_2180_cov_1.518020_3_plen_357_part_01